MPAKSLHFVLEEMLAWAPAPVLARHRYGCRVLERGGIGRGLTGERASERVEWSGGRDGSDDFGFSKGAKGMCGLHFTRSIITWGK